LLDADRFLALTYAPARARSALRALWELDASLGSMVAEGSQPLVVQMKLAWWREALAGLDRGDAPAQPLLVRLSETMIPAAITGESLSGLTDGWEYLLSPDPLTDEEAQAFAHLRGGRLFSLSARLLGSPTDRAVEGGGAAWALTDLARRSSRDADIRLALDAARTHLASIGRLPREMVPLRLLVMLASRDVRRGFAQLERRGSPGRMLRMLGYRLFGR
jgi:phytoene synthase